MKDSKEMICISCPVGCKLQVGKDENGKISVKGNSCARGKDYGIREYCNPVRIVTTSVWVEGGEFPLVSVKTAAPVPKELISSVLEDIKKIKAKAPIHVGDILFTNVAHTGVDIVATRNIIKRDCGKSGENVEYSKSH